MFDICVVGGGMVGSALAIGLGQLGLKVAVIEPNMPQAFNPSQQPDMRVSAISLTSGKLMSDLGAWTNIEAMRLCPYARLSVWDSPRCRTDFNSADLGQPYLGHIIENRIVQLGLHQTMCNFSNIELFTNQEASVEQSSAISKVQLSGGQCLEAKLLVGADGAQSKVRDAANIGVQGWQYTQQALGIKIKTNEPQQDITWQQFTPHGPMAYLPLFDGYGSLVWYQSVDQIAFLKSLSKAKLKQQIQEHFPSDLVDFEILGVANFSLTRMHANHYYKGNTVLIGDAAHTINPLAGQGVNLGFKDVAVLLEIIQKQLTQMTSDELFLNTSTWLKDYETLRRKDNLMMMSAMDALYATFSNSHLPLKFLRNLGLKLANSSGPLKKQAMKYAVGLN
ncbi:FAD-dependent monooxygenase [Paraglaciecola sp. 2405UD69-4]|uniref:FAD-dependent monooxygenase n=1 Tax=Paraglaciecola sp. 2405UD69-4 TaxID=3391836 RepID=UPI0039C9D65D